MTVDEAYDASETSGRYEDVYSSYSVTDCGKLRERKLGRTLSKDIDHSETFSNSATVLQLPRLDSITMIH